MRASEWVGLIRSLIVYWRPGRQRGLRRLYAPLVHEGDLVFDVGAHLGDRAAAFAALGARVIALEPQPRIARCLRRIVGRNERITVRAEAVGAAVGRARLAISRRTPTMSTLSAAWRESLGEPTSAFRDVRWEDSVEVPVVTLDTLIEMFGRPSFCKIDVEGYEAEVLAGLSHPVPGLSVEFVSGQLDRASACINRISELGAYRFNLVLGEGRDFVFETWEGADIVLAYLAAGAGGASSGDIYARLDRVGPADEAVREEAERGGVRLGDGERVEAEQGDRADD
ncbi:MAG: FkbM family methyltransferase [Gemmatimonadetes bacterium]|nr:FkbM family methyltransferase [Gemmatimonadota bacterium]